MPLLIPQDVSVGVTGASFRVDRRCMLLRADRVSAIAGEARDASHTNDDTDDDTV